MIPSPEPPTKPPPPMQPYVLLALALVVFALAAVVVAEVITGRSIPDATTIIGFGVTIITVLLGLLGIAGAVQNVHLAVNGRLDQLVHASAAEAYQKGLASAPVVVVPIAPPAPVEAPAPPAGG